MASSTVTSEGCADEPPDNQKPALSHSNSRTSLSVDIEDFLEVDAAQLLNHFRQAMDDMKTKFKKVNVLISGVTGAGKSSLVNAIFGRSLAEVSAGYPVTQHFTKYELPDKDVVIFDSKGLEHGEHESFINDTKEFLKNKGDFVKDCVHVIWYVVNSAGARFQPFEETVCRSLYSGAPIMFLLNKADISTDEQRSSLRNVIEGMQLKNCVGVFDTVSTHKAAMKKIDICPVCLDDDISVKRRKRVAKCNNCHAISDLTMPCGLDDIVSATHSVVPKVAAEAFISAQVVNFKLKDQQARKYIEDFEQESNQIRLQSSLLQSIASMLTKLSVLWDFSAHGHVYGMQIATSLVNQLTFRDKLLLLLWSQQSNHNYVLALGIVWNKCIRMVAKELFYDCCYTNMPPKKLEKAIHDILERSFFDLNDNYIRSVECNIADCTLKTVLDAEVEFIDSEDDLHSSCGSESDSCNDMFDRQQLLEKLQIEHKQFQERLNRSAGQDSSLELCVRRKTSSPRFSIELWGGMSM